MEKNLFRENEKIIRDTVHGDILIEDKFLKVINTKEFQRLRRIKQLSVASIVFPSAEHTRFSHSIGTFFIMKKIINHLEEEFKKLRITIPSRDKDMALVSALVHDIGHGPFSHAFESLISKKQKSHEEWTIEIITSKETEIHQKLCEEFDEDFPNEVASLIQKNPAPDYSKLNFLTMISTIISSQIDADRLDYLVRDSYNTGAKFGNIDIDRLISGLKMTIHNDSYTLYLPQKYLNDVEEYLFSRYQMNKSVYYHPTKVEYEQLIKLIFKRASELYNKNKLEQYPELLEKVFLNDLNVTNYCQLDESLFVWSFNVWKKSNDFILSTLCKNYLERKKFLKINILDNENNQVILFKKDLINILEDEYENNFFEDKYYFIEENYSYSMYKKDKENIKFLDNFGKLKDFSEMTNIFNRENKNKILEEKGKLIFINLDIIKHTHNISEETLIRIKSLINSYNYINHIEIEQKYFIDDRSIFNEIASFLSKEKQNYSIKNIQNASEVLQIDNYYDTQNLDLFKKDKTLRIREKKNKKILTFKSKIKQDDSDIVKNQYERYEYEKEIKDLEINNHLDFIKEKININFDEKNQLKKILKIKNNRKKIEFEFNNTKLEMAFDDFEYFDNNDKSLGKDFQVEVELKSEYSTKINLIKFCRILKNQFSERLEETISSKLKKGMELLTNNTTADKKIH